MQTFLTEEAAAAGFESFIFPGGGRRPKCAREETGTGRPAELLRWCTNCRSCFSVKKGTGLRRSRERLCTWVIDLCLTSPWNVSSMRLRRDVEVTETTAGYLLHRIREA